MKSILISIRPQWCEKIVNRQKTIEVRKTAPKETPFKAYIYETKAKNKWRFYDYEGAYENSKGEIVYAQQHVIGEFVCKDVILLEFQKITSYDTYINLKKYLKEMCLSSRQVFEYGCGKNLYGWHISDLKIYDKPKELSEFYTIAESGSDCCCGCVWHETPLEELPCRTCTGERKYLSRPPQSYMFVEEA